jgi:hypothetical protein
MGYVCGVLQGGCRVYMDSFLHGIEWIMFHGHVDWFFKNHLLEVGLTQNQEIVILRTLTTVGLFCCLSCVRRTHVNRKSSK